MRRVEASVVIKRPPYEIWDILTDMDRRSAAFGSKYTLTSPPPMGLGSTIEEEDGDKARVVEFNPKRSATVEIQIESRWARSALVGDLVEPAQGGTRYTLWFDKVEFTALGNVVQPILAPLWSRLLRRGLQRFKNNVEEGP